ncbi:MAG: SpoIIE family protein phosphatase [Bacilli bacterium]|nr:SpoIIE family protein phosphatase [Bacilli bacterium]
MSERSDVMSAFKKFFIEFKSIFTGEDVLKENEEHANVVVSTIMINIFFVALIIYLLTIVGLFNVNKGFMLDATLRSIFTLLIPGFVGLKLKGKGKYLKYILIICLTLSIGSIYSILTYTSTLLLIVPVLLAARYYSKKFTIFVSILTIAMLGVVEYLGIYYGLLDLNYVELPKGTVITIDTNILDAVKELGLNNSDIVKYVMLNSYLPKLFIYVFIIAFSCVQISQSGKNMLKRQKELSEEGARIESELNLARGIQNNMLPSTFPAFPEHKEIDIYAKMIPAKEVGGDFYDMFLIDDNHLAVTVADVSGKGVPAALIMMISRTLIKNTALNKFSVDEVFYKVNNLMCEGNTIDSFVTSWFGILDLKTGYMEYVNAGHNAPLIYKNKNKKIEFIKDKPNLVLAAMNNTKYTKHELKLEPGDRLFLYTDGVTEATNLNKELYGNDRLQNYLNSNISKSLTDTINGLKMDIDNFVGKEKQFDDITMLELLFKEYKTKENSKEFKANTKELNNVISYLDDYLNKNNISKKIVNQLDLVIEELFVNICNYAYEGKSGYFKISLENNDNKIIITLEDEGIKFNPLEKEEPDTTLSIEERSVGGLGILLVKKNLDNIKYKREDNKNILILEKSIKEDK